MKEPQWIPQKALIDLHREQLAEHGGLPGLPGEGGLESALARPKQVYAYNNEGCNIPTLAAAYAWGIAKNHPFTDGNKRMSLLAIAIFLGLNDYYLDAREEDAYLIMAKLAAGELDEAELTAWIDANSLHLDAVEPD